MAYINNVELKKDVIMDCRNYNRNSLNNNCTCHDKACNFTNQNKSNCGKIVKNCGCNRGTEPVDEMMPAMGFVPWQKWEDVFCIDDALEKGTIFGQLYKPLTGRCPK